MGTDLLTIVVLTILIFISLEFILVIIPALMNRAKVRKKTEIQPEIPDILIEPVSSEDQIIMRSWYIERSDSRDFVIKPLAIYPSSVPLDMVSRENSVRPVNPGPEPAHQEPEQVKDWNTINRINWKIQKANEAIKNANSAEFAWIDSLADIDPLEFVGKE